MENLNETGLRAMERMSLKGTTEEHTGEIVVYQPDEITRLEVKVENETVWLTQAQIAMLFGVKRPAITKHINNIYATNELERMTTCSILEHMGTDGKQRYHTMYYNLDMILSVGYRVNSRNAIAFRRWSSGVLKDYMLRGYAIKEQLSNMESRLSAHERVLEEHSKKIDFFVRTSLPPVEGVFYDGQVYDAYAFVAALVRRAKERIVLIDNYIDDTVLTMLGKRTAGVDAVIYTAKITKELQLDLQKHNAQYQPIEVRVFKKSHDRFLIIDNEVYLIGASLKDLGKKWFGFTKMESLSAEELIGRMG